MDRGQTLTMNESHIFQPGSLIPVSFTCWQTQKFPKTQHVFFPSHSPLSHIPSLSEAANRNLYTLRDTHFARSRTTGISHPGGLGGNSGADRKGKLSSWSKSIQLQQLPTTPSLLLCLPILQLSPPHPVLLQSQFHSAHGSQVREVRIVLVSKTKCTLFLS